MTEEAQRIAVAEACGWVNQGKAKHVQALEHRWLNPRSKEVQTGCPDFLHDLNAIHDAALSLKLGQRTTYGVELRRIVVRDETPEMADPDGGPLPDLYFYEATAAQRAEAFLRAIGKWTEA